MQPSQTVLRGACVLAALAIAGAPRAQPPIEMTDVSAVRPVAAVVRPRATPAVPFELIPAAWRDAVAKVVQQPTLTTRAGPEEVRGGLYEWLLDHPDRASRGWQRLGV